MQTKNPLVRSRLPVLASRLSSSGRQAMSSLVPEAAISVEAIEKFAFHRRAAAGEPFCSHSKSRASLLSPGFLSKGVGAKRLRCWEPMAPANPRCSALLATLLLPTRGRALAAGHHAVRGLRAVRLLACDSVPHLKKPTGTASPEIIVSKVPQPKRPAPRHGTGPMDEEAKSLRTSFSWCSL